MLKTQQEIVWKALADSTRRQILDLLTVEPKTTGEICGKFKNLTRFGVMKHLSLLEEAKLVLTRKEGRMKWHFLNAVPIQQIYDRWVSKYLGRHSRPMTDLKNFIENKAAKKEK